MTPVRLLPLRRSRPSVYDSGYTMKASTQLRSDTVTPSPPLHEGSGLHARVRRFALAWLLGAAVVVLPAWPTAAHERAGRRPAFERALTWRDFIRMRLSPWLLLQDAFQRADRE
jgi:hypothetical protein